MTLDCCGILEETSKNMDNSRTGNSVKNISFSMANKIITLVLSFVSRSIFIYCLGIEYLGIQGLFSDILTMLSLADLGFGAAMTFSMYKPLAENDTEKLAALTSFYRTVYRVIAIVIIIIGVALIPFLKYLVNTEAEIPYLTLYYILYLANTVASYLVVYKTSILSADQKEYIITKYTSLFNILCTVVSCIFLIITRNYIIYLCIQVIFTYIRNFSISHKAEKMYPYINENGNLSNNEKKNLFKIIGSGFVYKITGVILSGTDNTLISVLVGTVAVGYYSNYTIVSNQLSGFINIIFYSLTASLGNLVAQEGRKKRFEVFSIIQSISLIVSSFCVICLFCLQEDFIRVWLGEEYLLDSLVLVAIVVNLYFTIVLYPIRVYRDATGLYQKTKFIMLMTAIVNIVVSIILGKMIGLAGILFATSISRVVTYFWYEPIVLFKEHFDRSSLYYFIEIAKNIVVICFISVIEYFICRYIKVVGWGTLICKGCIVGVIAIVCIIIIYHKSEGAKMILSQIRKLIKL
jgi:O-antigen/teichoic acid export membrane protein